jgi:hypothetical protein
LAYQNGPSNQATARQWLQGHGSQQQIENALAGVLANLWAQAFAYGVATAGIAGLVLAAALQAAALSRLSHEWLTEITDTRIARLAAVLAKGGTLVELAAAISAVMADHDAALLIASTELNRALNAGRVEAYRKARVPRVRWITTSAHPCEICLMNEAAGPRHLGEPFPSGAVAPPEHPQCACELIKAED